MRQVFREHFGKLLLGAPTNFEKLVEKERVRAQRAMYRDAVPKTTTAAPTMSDCIRGNIAAPRYKAVAENQVADDLLKVSPTAAAAVWHPLVVKTALTLRPPLQWVGGMAVELLKAQTTCEGYRDVTITAEQGKIFGKHVRSQLFPPVEQWAFPTQCGSVFRGGGTDTAHLCLRSMFVAAEAAKVCMAALFVDVSSVIASMVSRFVVPAEGYQPDEDLARSLVAAGLTAAEAAAAVQETVSVVIWEAQGAHAHSVALAAAMHEHTWISTEGLPGVLETVRGTLAGTSLADIMYGVLMRRVLGRCREALAAEGLVGALNTPGVDAMFGLHDGTCGLVVNTDDISYVEDAVFPVLAPACDITSKLKATASVVHS